MKVIINDANILIDLIRIDIVDSFFKLSNFELKTTDFVFSELYDEQQIKLTKFVDSQKFEILESNQDDLQLINQIFEMTMGLSFEDCSAFHYERKFNGFLLTGDRKLRKYAESNRVEVRGILYIFDMLIEQQLLSFEIAFDKIKILTQLNKRLPENEINKRIILWQEHKALR